VFNKNEVFRKTFGLKKNELKGKVRRSTGSNTVIYMRTRIQWGGPVIIVDSME
jgi:hypothetical protein